MVNVLVRRFLLSLIIFLASVHATTAQQVSCATQMNMSISRHSMGTANARQLDINVLDEFQPIHRLAISANIVRNSDGSGGITEQYLFDEIDNVNTFFLDAGIQFYVDQISYVNNSNLYDFSATEESTLANSRDVPNSINLYFVESIAFFIGTACGYAYLPDQGPDRIIIAETCGLDGNTLAHEFGHFFNLIHTHGESNSFNSTDELADGSNCDVAGDLVCDTPADPVLTNQVNSSCVYTGTFLDPNQQAYNPDTRNLLSYSRGSCRDEMTSGQLDRVKEAWHGPRSYIKTFPVQSNFEADVRKVCQNEQISYSDLSVGASEWEWVFEGGEPNVSSQQNPIVTYDVPGKYNVSLKVSSPDGEDVLNFEDYIIVRPTPQESQTMRMDFENVSNINEIETETNGVFEFDIAENYSSQGNKSIWLNSFSNLAQDAVTTRFFTSSITQNLNEEFLLQFDMAYKMRDGFSDRLDISIESYCDRIAMNIYSESETYLSGNEASEVEFFPQDLDWRVEGTFLSLENNMDPFNVVFESISQGGNNLFIDNIRLRPVKAIDVDSMTLVSIYKTLNGQLPWDMKENVSSWQGVVLSDEDKVTTLDFTDFGINAELPTSIANLDGLDSLILDGNSIIPTGSMTQLSTLNYLSIVGNGLNEVPQDWSGMSALRKLDIRNNMISSLPGSLLTLPSLESLNARNNKLLFPSGIPIIPSQNLKKLNLSVNGFIESPNFTNADGGLAIDLSQNDLSLAAISTYFSGSVSYSPQNMLGVSSYIESQSELTLNCPIPVESSNPSIHWFRNNETLVESTSELVISDLSPAYYYCTANDTGVPGLSLYSRPYLVNTFNSICDENLAGVYQSSTVYFDANQNQSQVDDEIILIATDNQVYSFSDLSFGVESQRYNEGAWPNSMNFDCGQFFIPETSSYSYKVLGTELDIINGTIIIEWVNHRGGMGTTTLVQTTPGLSNNAEIQSFQFNSQSAPEIINGFDKTVILRVGCSEFSNVSSFVLSNGAQAYVDNELQASGVSAQDFTSPVTYTILAEDGVSSNDWTITLLEEPSIVEATFSVVDQSHCDPLNGSITINSVTVDGVSRIDDLEDFDIVWSDDPSFENAIGSGLGIGDLRAGQYHLKISEISSGCGIEFGNIQISDVTPVGNFSIVQKAPDRSCGGDKTGVIETTVEGLSNDLTIAWSYRQNGIWNPIEEFDGLLEISEIPSGEYQQEILDNVTGCLYVQATTVESRPAQLTIETSLSANTDCENSNGSISVEAIIEDGVNLGIPQVGYSVEWYDEPTMQNVIDTSPNLINLDAGSYYLKITNDALLCESQIYSFFVPNNTLSANVQVTGKADNTLCSSSESNGSIAVSVDGTLEDFKFEWHTGTNIESLPVANGPVISGISGGTYTVVVTSLVGPEINCFSTLSASIVNDIEELSLSLKSDPLTSCLKPNGKASVDEFLINGSPSSLGGAYAIDWSTNRFFGTVMSNSESISGIEDAQYFARVSNSITKCKSSTESIRVLADLPSIEAKFIINNNTNCTGPFTGSIELTDLEPLDSYSISWYNQSLDDQPISISTDTKLLNLKSGKYYTIVEHIESGCTEEYEHTVVDQIVLPKLAVNNISQTNCTMPNGVLEIIEITEGGMIKPNENYYIEWSLSDDFSDVLSTNSSIDGLDQGLYYSRIQNIISGCSSAVVDFTVEDKTVLPIIGLEQMLEEKPALGELGELIVDIDYDGEFTITWYSSDNTEVNSLGSETILSSLTAGSYIVKVETENGCISSSEFTVSLDERQLQEIQTDIPSEVLVDTEDIDLIGSSTSGLPVLFEIENGPGRISLGKLVINGPGEIVILAKVGGNENYFESQRTIKVIAKPLIQLSGSLNGASTGIAKIYNTEWDFIQQSSFSDGKYVLDELLPGDYYLEIIPSDFNSAVNTYYPSTYKWETAELLKLSEDHDQDVDVITLPEFEVGSRLEGIVGGREGNSLITLGELKDVNTPMRNLSLYLIEATSNNIYASSSSDVDGSLSLDPVPSGNYFLHMNEIGNSIDLSSVVFSVDGTSNEQITLELGDNDQVELVVVSGIQDWVSGEVNLFPNPITDELNISLEGALSYPVNLNIFNLAGAMIKSETILPGSSSFRLTLSSLLSGTYLVQLSDHKGIMTKKIIKR